MTQSLGITLCLGMAQRLGTTARLGLTQRLGTTQRFGLTQRLGTTQHLGTSHTSHQFAPRGQCPPAQGCGLAATLGLRHHQSSDQPQRGCVCIGVTSGEGHNPVGVGGFVRTFSQGSGQPATLGWPMQSRWDSGQPPLEANRRCHRSITIETAW